MKKIIALFIALAATIGALGIGQTTARASWSTGAACTSGSGSVKWYVHGPYDHDHNGTLWSWFSVVSAGTNVPYPPDVEGQCFDANGQPYRIDWVALDAWSFYPNGGAAIFENWETWRTIAINSDSVYATEPYQCNPTTAYRTRVRYYLNDANHTSGVLATSWYHPC